MAKPLDEPGYLSGGHAALAALYRDTWQPSWRPPPRLSVSEWAGRYRYLSPEASAEPGLWNNARAPHLVAPMDRLSPTSPTERVVLKFSSQSGKSEALLCLIGYIIDLDPGPILAIQPNVTPMGEAFSKDRIKPMLRDSPSLAAKIGGPKGRTSAQTILHTSFPAGHLTIAGANSPAGLASRPIRYLLCDELDRWEITKEGDPLLLARKRLQTFRARRTAKELIVSSPTYDDLGICAEYDRCGQRWEWHLACLHCGARQLPALKHFHHDGDPKGLRYVCATCGAEHPLVEADAVKATGAWVCVQDGPEDSVGYRFNQWASPFARWDDTLQEWLDAGTDPARRQAVTNTVFAEPWEGEGEKIEPSLLSQRAEDWGEALPNGIIAVTMGCDVQGDRLEVETVGWGKGWESWSLAYDVLPGEPTAAEVWEDLLALYRQPWTRADGQTLRPLVLCVDSGAYTQHVYQFVKGARDKGVIPIKGIAGMEREPLAGDKRARLKRMAARLREGRPAELLGVDNLKRTVFAYLSAKPGAVGYCHFPVGRSEEYYAQLTGERLMVVAHRGRRPERRWVPIHPAVEALDARVYALAACHLAGLDLHPAKPATGGAIAAGGAAADGKPGQSSAPAIAPAAPPLSSPYTRPTGRAAVKRRASTWL